MSQMEEMQADRHSLVCAGVKIGESLQLADHKRGFSLRAKALTPARQVSYARWTNASNPLPTLPFL